MPKTRKKEYEITQPHNKGTLINKPPAKHNVNVFMVAEFDRKLKADSVRVLILEIEQDFDINLNSISVIKRNVRVLSKTFHSLLEIIQQLRHNDQIIKDYNLFDTKIQEFRLTHINYKMGLERFIDSRLRYENKREFNILSRDAIFSPFFVDPEKKIFNINLSLIHVFKLFERIPMPLVGTQIREVYLRMWLSHEMLHFKLSHWVYESLQEIQVELLKFYYIEILERESIVSRFGQNPRFAYYQKRVDRLIEMRKSMGDWDKPEREPIEEHLKRIGGILKDVRSKPTHVRLDRLFIEDEDGNLIGL